jgi:hypothetical protein
MWRGSGYLPRHAARRGQRGHRVQKKSLGVILKNKLKKVRIKKLSERRMRTDGDGCGFVVSYVESGF